MRLMLPPDTAINMVYANCNVVPGVPVEVSERDIESLKAEGWTSTEAGEPHEEETNPPRRRARRSKKVSK